MNRQFAGSTFLVLVASLFLHIGGSGRVGALLQQSPTPGQKAAPKKADAASAVQQDGQTCYPFEVLLRQAGTVEQPWLPESPESAHDKNGGFVCSVQALLQRVQPPRHPKKEAMPARTPVTAVHKPVPLPPFSGRALIATVPDPLETSDSLEFDRAIAALQEAGSVAGYDFERIATPWEISDLQEPKDLKEGREDQYYRRVFGDEPGAMLFDCKPLECEAVAGKPEQLLLLLVPESPVYGLNMHAAREALAAYSAVMAVNTDKRVGLTPIYWIGPEYSASAADLERLRLDPGKTVVKPTFCALSGSISGTMSVNLLKKSNELVTGCRLDTGPTLSALDIEALTQLVKLPAFRHGTIALVSEDETSYGGDPIVFDYEKSKYDFDRIGDVPYRRFTFPRGVSHVRGLYGKALRDASAVASQQDGSTPTSAILDFADTLQQPSDSAEEFAAQSPVSDESIIASIATSVAHIHAETIVILATDPLDQVFLARYFHRNAPESRLVLFAAERLLPRLRGEFNLDGTIVVSRFSLFEDSYLILPYPLENRHSLNFASSGQEGIFLSALEQMLGIPIKQALGRQVNDQWLWVGVAGGGNFWPVAYQGDGSTLPQAAEVSEHFQGNGLTPAAFTHATTALVKPAPLVRSWAKTEVSDKQPSTTRQPVQEFDTNDPLSVKAIQVVDTPDEAFPRLWTFTLQVSLLCSFIHLLFFLAATNKNRSSEPTSIVAKEASRRERLTRGISIERSRVRRHRILSYYFLFADQSLEGEPVEAKGMVFYFGHSWWLMNLGIILFTVLAYLLLPAIVYRFSVRQRGSLLQSISALGWITLLMMVCQALLVAYLAGCSVFLAWWSGYKYKRQRCAATLAPLASIVWMLVCLWLFCRQIFAPGSGWLFAFRSLHLSSGVCPILPLLLVSAGLLAITVAYLNALTLCSTRDPQCPKLTSSEYLFAKEWSLSLRTYMDDWSGLPVRLWLVLLVILAALICIFKPWEALSTFDSGSIAQLYCLLFLTCTYFAVLLAVKFLNLWRVLQFGLESLEASPLRHAFSRLPRIFSPGPIWSYAGLRRQVILLWRGIEYLRVSPRARTRPPNPDDVMQGLYPLAEKIKRSEQFEPGEYQVFNNRLNEYVTELDSLPLIKAAWDRGGPDLTGNSEKDDGRCKCPDSEKPTAEKKTTTGTEAHRDVPAPCGFEQSEWDACAVARANEFIASRFAFYIRYVTFHLKNFMTFMSVSMLFLVLAAVSYPFNHESTVLWEVTSILLLILIIVATVLKQMDRDAILSRLSDTEAGKLNVWSYLLQLLSVGGLPVLTVLASIFPPLGNFVYSFARPILQNLH